MIFKIYCTEETVIGVGQKRIVRKLSAQKYQKICIAALTFVGVAGLDDIIIKFTRSRIEWRDQLIGSDFEFILQNSESFGDHKFHYKIFFARVEKIKIGIVQF